MHVLWRTALELRVIRPMCVCALSTPPPLPHAKLYSTQSIHHSTARDACFVITHSTTVAARRRNSA